MTSEPTPSHNTRIFVRAVVRAYGRAYGPQFAALLSTDFADLLPSDQPSTASSRPAQQGTVHDLSPDQNVTSRR